MLRMNRFVRIVFPVLMLALVLGASIHAQEKPTITAEAESAAPEPNYVYWATVVRVLDGGTVLLNIDLGFDTWAHNQAIPLLDVKAPKITGETKEEGLNWKSKLEKLLPSGTEVILQSTKDKSGKAEGYFGVLWVDDVNVNEAMK